MVTLSLLPYSLIELCSVDTQDSIMYLSGCRVAMHWRSSPCALSIFFLLGLILKWKLYSGELGHVGINEKMAPEEIDRFITDPSGRDVGGKTDFHLPFCFCWAPTPWYSKVRLPYMVGKVTVWVPCLPCCCLASFITRWPICSGLLGTIPISQLCQYNY